MLVEAAAVAVIASIASGCNTDFLPDDEGQPMVVVNVVATPDRELTARVTRTWPHSQWPKPDVTLADASVAYTVNGRPCGLMTFNDSTKSFTAPYVPTEGDEIAIEVVSEQYGTAAGYTKVPRKVKIDHWSFTPVEFTDFNGIVDDGTSLSYLRRLDIRYSITFTDPAGEENYYMLTGRPYYEPGGGISTDPIISENDTPLEAVFSDRKTFIVFSDRNIDGRTYTFSYTCSYEPFIPIEEWARGRITDRMALCSISRDYYLYLLSVYKKYGDLNSNLENLGLSEPKIIYSNVNPGIGIIGSQSADSIVNDVHDIVCDFVGVDPDYWDQKKSHKYVKRTIDGSPMD